MEVKDETRGGLASLSRTSRAVAAFAAAVVAILAIVHIGTVFLYLAPSNVVSQRFSTEINDYISPEFVQNWKLFAPEPLHVNVAVHARADVRGADGSSRTTGWINLSAADIDATLGNPLPSHTRNQIRKGWRTFVRTHDRDYRATSLTGLIIEEYLKRIAVRRLGEKIAGGTIERVQLRAVTTRVPEPSWSRKRSNDKVSFRLAPWWQVGPEDHPQGGGR